LEEFRTNDGELNENLEPEKGINYELGIRGNTRDGKLTYDVAAFFFKLTESIVLTESKRDGTLAFANAGSTDQKGLEVAMNWIPIINTNAFLTRVELQTAYTFHYFKFDEYVVGGDDYSGNRLTGVAPHTISSSVLMETKPGIYSFLSYNFTDEIPLTDGNTIYSNPYHLVKGRIGFRKMFGEKFKLDIYAGGDNLLDQKYSLGYDINAFGNRFFQPAAGINWFGGVKINYAIIN
jgi:iron complex outermembrane receptor protein